MDKPEDTLKDIETLIDLGYQQTHVDFIKCLMLEKLGEDQKAL